MLDENSSLIKGISTYKKLFYVLLFFTITPITLLSSLASLISLNKPQNSQNVLGSADINIDSKIENRVNIYSSNSNSLPIVSVSYEVDDARPDIIRNYLLKYNSPLAPYADFIVKIADKNDVDYRLITAIAQQESNLCKVIPEETYNCWGWGIHSRGTLGFESYEEGIETVTQGIKEKYIDKGYSTPDEIMTKYTPLSNGSWAYGVNSFMNQLQ